MIEKTNWEQLRGDSRKLDEAIKRHQEDIMAEIAKQLKRIADSLENTPNVR